jgi:hypothetical protein
MNTITYISATCTCTNQHLLTPGVVCEICMGMVPEQSFETEQPSATAYGPEYFEAIEQMQVDSGLAA